MVFALDYEGYNGSIDALKNSGYAITWWPISSGDVPIGTEVDVRALTTDSIAIDVRIRWINPTGVVRRNVVLTLEDKGNTCGSDDVIEAWDSFILDEPLHDGEGWGVHAIFLYSKARTKIKKSNENDVFYIINNSRALLYNK